MAYKKVSKNYTGKFNEVTIGTGDKAVTMGGKNTLPLHKFDGEAGHAPKLGLEILDIAPAEWDVAFNDIYSDALGDPAAWAKLVEEKHAPDFIYLRFAGADPDGENKSVEHCVEVAKKVDEATDLPLVVGGCGNDEKDGEIFKAVSEALEGKNILVYSAVEDNYKTVGASSGLAYNQKVGAESAVDINLAKQLNILLSQLGVKNETIVMNPGTATVGYGFEYVTSAMDRIILAALGQNDDTLQMPIMTEIASEAWGVRESVATVEDEPAWGPTEQRGIHMEISTAASCIASGSDAVILRHPTSLETLKTFVNGIMG